MKIEIFNQPAMIEPDRQLLARYAIDVVKSLGGNIFSTAITLNKVLQGFHSARGELSQTPYIGLYVEDSRVYISWAGACDLLSTLPETPGEPVLKELAQHYRNLCEHADPELLHRRNTIIQEELEKAKQRAAVELAQLEANLDRKKIELQESIKAAETDSLTGLYNRGGYDMRLNEAMRRCQRQNESLSLILLDLDYFKQVNDQHGHQHGDEYLRRMAESIRSSIREYVDFPCRTGGDEFAVIVFSTPDIAGRIAETILLKMNGKVSIGIAEMLAHESADKLVARADAALYEAKHQGRGRVVQWRESIPPGRQAAG